MSKTLIIVEGIADVVFLRDYIKILKPNSIMDKSKLKDDKIFIISIDDREIRILIGGGYACINNLSPKIREFIDDNYNIVTIQDADNPNKDKKYGGVTKRMNYLDNIENKNKISFKTFLFPNHKDDGDLENLLLRIKNKTQYNLFNDCYENYINCTLKISRQEFADELREDKYKVFDYFRTYYGMMNAKEQNRYYEAKYWDFNHKELLPLKKFLDSLI